MQTVDDLAMVVPRQERSIESTEALIQAATALFVERGYTATTVAAIGERAGYSRGIVATRFGCKENLAWAVVQQASRRWNDEFYGHSSEGTGLDGIVDFIRISRDNMVEDPTSRMVLERLYSESAAPLAPLHDRFQESQAELEERVASLLRRGIDDGSIRSDLDPLGYATVLISQLRGVGYQWFLFPDHVEPVAHHQVITDQVVHWLAA